MIFSHKKKVKTRKEHRCWGCRKILPKGSIINTITSVDADGFNTIRWCNICERVLDSHIDEIDHYRDGIEYGIIIDEYLDWYNEEKEKE